MNNSQSPTVMGKIVRTAFRVGLFGLLYGLLLKKNIAPFISETINQILTFGTGNQQIPEVIRIMFFNGFFGVVFGVIIGCLDYISRKLAWSFTGFVIAGILGVIGWGIYLTINLVFSFLSGLMVNESPSAIWYAWRQEASNVVLISMGVFLASYEIINTGLEARKHFYENRK